MYFLLCGSSIKCRKTEASTGANSIGPSPNTCRRNRMVPVRAERSMSIRTWLGNREDAFRDISIVEYARISVKVWMHTSLNGSSACSATAITARSTVSESCTAPGPGLFSVDVERTAPKSTTVRMSLITCSFSTECLLSRRRDLGIVQTPVCRTSLHLLDNVPI